MGVDAPFSQIPRHGALLIGVIIAPLMDRSRKFDDKLEIFSTAAGDKGVLSMVMIFLLAGAFAGVAKGMGGVDSVVNLLTFIPTDLWLQDFLSFLVLFLLQQKLPLEQSQL